MLSDTGTSFHLQIGCTGVTFAALKAATWMALTAAYFCQTTDMVSPPQSSCSASSW